MDETESIIVERFGAISAIYDRDQDRGLHFKLPWPIETARRFDNRVQFLNLPPREILTRDKKNITLDAYVCLENRRSRNGKTKPNGTAGRSCGFSGRWAIGRSQPPAWRRG